MARPIQRIEGEIEELESAIASLAEEFYQVYSKYTQHLGPAVRQQLILASYHICTQGYPQEFLALSLSRRQQLQEAIKDLAQKAEGEIRAIVSRPLQASPTFSSEEEEEENSEADSEPQSSDLSILESEEEPPVIQTPQALAQWQENVEKEIFEQLDFFSQEINQVLRAAHIFTEDVPQTLLELAKQAMGAHESLAPSVPNILSLVLEADNFLNPRRQGDFKGQMELPERLLKQHQDSIPPVIIGLQKGDYDEDEDEDEDEDDELDPIALLPFSLPLKILVVKLRLSDIEFSDPRVTSYRNQLRHLQDRLRSRGQDYQRKQKEYAIAQAESAWRSSWIEDRE
ncbi:hypothetical protein [Roseofilum capinflatum]|uniref:Heterocyst differentiation control protein n=1 Tax=Roseofilum capinflatum BLCC-M114 TaxID=3022440 RepID=A0ABT7BAC2_9CYAN|nr:hypothetical protein [Roseofilum capinflatum]MDJ1176124.1 hypothetical protein [Roseofilum capinflatum BLCC-M114]